MSLSVLKKKSNTKYSKISSKKGYFSLNNPRRVYSHSNQPQTQTPMKGNVPRGHGSCCGKYPVVINNSQYKNYDYHIREFNGPKANPGISVKNNRGSIDTRFKWIKSTYPNYIVKKMNDTDYSEYYYRINGQNATTSTSVNEVNCVGAENCKTLNSHIVKRVDTLDYSEYLKTSFLNKKCLPPPNSKAPVPVPVQGNCTGCNAEAPEPDNENGNCN
uniref:Uncharacterized protein n=1 Tax=Florenciella sp. virus SA2 TaxID=3240092 RepID=A0AB39J8K1_9VIRU